MVQVQTKTWGKELGVWFLPCTSKCHLVQSAGTPHTCLGTSAQSLKQPIQPPTLGSKTPMKTAEFPFFCGMNCQISTEADHSGCLAQKELFHNIPSSRLLTPAHLLCRSEAGLKALLGLQHRSGCFSWQWVRDSPLHSRQTSSGVCVSILNVGGQNNYSKPKTNPNNYKTTCCRQKPTNTYNKL